MRKAPRSSTVWGQSTNDIPILSQNIYRHRFEAEIFNVDLFSILPLQLTINDRNTKECTLKLKSNKSVLIDIKFISGTSLINLVSWHCFCQKELIYNVINDIQISIYKYVYWLYLILFINSWS